MIDNMAWGILWHKRIGLLVLVSLVFVMPLLAQDELSPERTITWPSKTPNLYYVNNNLLFFSARNTTSFELWQWNGDTINILRPYIIRACAFSAAVISNERFALVASKPVDKNQHIYIQQFGDSNIPDRQPLPSNWYVTLGRPSRNGGHLPVWGQPFPDRDQKHPTIRIGVVRTDNGIIDWYVTLASDFFGAILSNEARAVSISDDGKYIGVAGWGNQYAMIDSKKKRVLWQIHPNDEASPTCLDFASDNKYAYAGGVMGAMYEVEIASGRVHRQWNIPNVAGSKEPYCREISSISVSPNGRFVAVGVFPAGAVWLYSIADGHCWLMRHTSVNRTARVDIISFSPNSKRLASYAAGEIKIWKLPEGSARADGVDFTANGTSNAQEKTDKKP